FEAIFTVSPWQSWRSDGLILAANRTNLTVSIPPQAPPSQPEVDAFKANSLTGLLNEGSARAWLGHLQVLNAARNHSSVLILEDDADWDVRIHDQVKLVASAMRNLSTPSNVTAAPGWPWGNHWDVLWLGHCGERLPFPEEIDDAEAEAEDDYILLNDTSLPDTVLSYDARLGDSPPYTRWIQYAAGPICSFAYAVNGRSVAHILDDFTHGAAQAWDMWLHTRCRTHDLRCFSANPELFHHHIPAAASNLRHSLVNTHLQNEGTHNYTANIRFSARCNWDKGDDELVSCMEQ
ncbi:hypothetical protein IWX49DRAFT_504198, partial [Phyllosticta citricarpa]